MSEVIQLDKNDNDTMKQQLDYYQQELESTKEQLGELWAKLEAIELIVKGLRGMI